VLRAGFWRAAPIAEDGCHFEFHRQSTSLIDARAMLFYLRHANTELTE
jgi:hypothetical protein